MIEKHCFWLVATTNSLKTESWLVEGWDVGLEHYFICVNATWVPTPEYQVMLATISCNSITYLQYCSLTEFTCDPTEIAFIR